MIMTLLEAKERILVEMSLDELARSLNADRTPGHSVAR